jgi:hypothetical protein
MQQRRELTANSGANYSVNARNRQSKSRLPLKSSAFYRPNDGESHLSFAIFRELEEGDTQSSDAAACCNMYAAARFHFTSSSVGSVDFRADWLRSTGCWYLLKTNEFFALYGSGHEARQLSSLSRSLFPLCWIISTWKSIAGLKTHSKLSKLLQDGERSSSSPRSSDMNMLDRVIPRQSFRGGTRSLGDKTEDISLFLSFSRPGCVRDRVA